MVFHGGCYCGKVRYTADGEPAFKAQCHCRECQYITGGGPNYFMMMPTAGFRYDQGSAAEFTRSDLERPVTREFCSVCGTHLVTRPPGMPMLVLKVGTLDDPARYGGPQVAIYTVDRQAFHCIAEGLPTFERLPR
jgi:hypothetical protein